MINLDKAKLKRQLHATNISPAEDETRIKKLKSNHLPPSTIFSHLQNILKVENSYLKDQSNLISEWLESEVKIFVFTIK